MGYQETWVMTKNPKLFDSLVVDCEKSYTDMYYENGGCNPSSIVTLKQNYNDFKANTRFLVFTGDTSYQKSYNTLFGKRAQILNNKDIITVPVEKIVENNFSNPTIFENISFSLPSEENDIISIQSYDEYILSSRIENLLDFHNEMLNDYNYDEDEIRTEMLNKTLVDRIYDLYNSIENKNRISNKNIATYKNTLVAFSKGMYVIVENNFLHTIDITGKDTAEEVLDSFLKQQDKASLLEKGEYQRYLLEKKDLKQNESYFILDETNSRAVAFSPTAPSNIVIWDRDKDGDYRNGRYGNTLNGFELGDLKFLGINTKKIVSILDEVGFNYHENNYEDENLNQANDNVNPIVEENYMDTIYKNAQKEYTDLLNSLEKETPKIIINHAYEIMIKQELLGLLETFDDLPDSNKQVLFPIEQPLSYLYSEWLSNDNTMLEDLRDTIIEATHDYSSQNNETVYQPINEQTELKSQDDSINRKTVYVCSPLSGEIENNIRRAREFSKYVALQGATPIAPHITELFDDTIPEERTLGLSLGIDYLKKADEIWVFGNNISLGMANEIKTAKEELHIPIYHVDENTKNKVPYDEWSQQQNDLSNQTLNKGDIEMSGTNEPKPYVSKEQIEMAEQVDLLNYVNTNGYVVKPHGSVFKLIEGEHDSTVIFPNTNSWCNMASGIGGKTIDFLVKHEGKDFVSAVKELIGEAKITRNLYRKEQYIDKPKEPMILPPHNEDNKRVYAYLIKTRKIDRDIVKQCIDNGQIYQSNEVINKDDKNYVFNNCIFVGKDEEGNPRYASQRSMNDIYGSKPFKQDVENSLKEYGFLYKGHENAQWLSVCEAPIDVLSKATLNKLHGEENSEHIISLGGVSDKAIDKFLETNNKIKVINVCLDNDEAGRTAGEKIREKYTQLGFTVLESYPKEKDYNLELQKAVEKSNKLSIDLPSPSTDTKQSFQHLTENKKLDKDLISSMLKDGSAFQVNRTIYRDDKPYSVSDTVFVQKDKQGNPTYGISVNHNTNIDKSDFKIEYKNEEQAKCYISYKGETSNLLVFNNPISMLSYHTIEKAKGNQNIDNCICCLSKHNEAIEDFINQNTNIKEIQVRLDKAIGINKITQQPFDFRENTFNNIEKKFKSKKIKVVKSYPKSNSLNQDLVNVVNKTKQKQTKVEKNHDNSFENEQ